MSHKLLAKLIIKGQIETLTGLHIGGSKSSLNIGEVDLNVIKSPIGKPFIPGSSLKGKLRSLLARTFGSVKDTKDPLYIKEIFGSSGDNREDDFEQGENDENKGQKQQFRVTRLLVRDAELNETAFNTVFEDAEMDFPFTDVKFENVINRVTGTAEHPRQLERVPANAKFKFEMVYDVYDDGEGLIEEGDNETRLVKHLGAIYHAMQLLQDDYLGGQGSRGYGKIRFGKDIKLLYKPITDYKPATELAEPFSSFESKLKSLYEQARNLTPIS
jgi:CRISPR-associated protein Csm3